MFCHDSLDGFLGNAFKALFGFFGILAPRTAGPFKALNQIHAKKSIHTFAPAINTMYLFT